MEKLKKQITMENTILSENLIIALTIAIEEQEKSCKKVVGPDFESGLVAGWKQNLKALQSGAKLTVK